MVNHHHDGGYVLIGGHRYARRDLWRGRGYMRGAYRMREPTVVYVQPAVGPLGVETGLIIVAGLVLVGGLAIWASTRT